MTVGQFLDKINNSLSDVRRDIFFQFTDARGVVWKSSSENHACYYFGDFPCNIVCQDEKNIVFDLDLNSIPSNLVSTFNEIYDQPAKKSDKQYSEVTVSECLNAYSKLESKPSVYFKQLVHLKNGLYADYREFTTSELVSLNEAINGLFSYFLVDKIIENKDCSITIYLETPAKEQYEKKKKEQKREQDLQNQRWREKKEREKEERVQQYQRWRAREARIDAIRSAIVLAMFVGIMLAMSIAALTGETAPIGVAVLATQFVGITLGILALLS